MPTPSKSVTYIYDFASPNGYFVHRVLPGIAAKHGATLAYSPALLGGIFKATNNQAPMMAFQNVTGKLAYQRTEIARFIERHGVEFTWNPAFPINTLPLMRAAVYAEGQPWKMDYVNAVMDAMWRDAKNMGDPDVIGAVLSAAGLPVAKIMEAIQTPEVKAKLVELTEAAVARGVFGLPAMFVGDEMFFGKDSLDDLNWRLGQ
ncbi:MAG: 2-hydroxychromene-2-carboxylate isomerase [Pseudomonadota bacterium]